MDKLLSNILQLQKEQISTLKEMREALYELKTELKKVSLFKKEVLSLAEASQLTGISASDLYKRTSNRSIPFFKPSGKLIFFRRTELEAWLTSNRVSTVMEIEEKAMKFQICKN